MEIMARVASPETWENMEPSGWVIATPVTCTIDVYNEGGFTQEAEYQYKTGADWSSWTGDGLEIIWIEAPRRHLIVADIPFPHSVTEDQNQIKFRIKDELGEWMESDVYPVRVDTGVPSSTIEVSACYRSAVEIRGTASDVGSGVSLVEIQLQRGSDGFYYSGSSWQATAQWITVPGTMTWSLPFVPAVETVYTVTSRAEDVAGNVQSPLSTASFRYDVTAPQSTVSTTGHFRPDNWPGRIQGTASDAGSGVAYVVVQLQRDLDGLYYDGSAWEAAATWITMSETLAWSLPFTPTAEALYTVTSMAADHCGNMEAVPDTGVFTYDATPPDSVATTVGCLDAWPGSVTGTASDAVSGVAVVQITLQRAFDGLYYNGSSWEPTAGWITTSGTTDWSLPLASPMETTYLVTSRARDNAGNWQSPYSLSAFTYDVSAPESAISTTGYFNTWGGLIEGWATDQASGVESVQITIQRGSDGLYYDGTVWGTIPTWLAVFGAGPWSLPFTPTVETVYTVTSQATDYCENVQSPLGVGTFTYDVTPPESAVATTGCYNFWPGLIEGTASDATSGVAAVQVTVQRASDGFYYGGFSWGPAAGWITASGSATWSLPFIPTVETLYTVTSRAVDRSGNTQGVPALGEFVFDVMPPQSSVTTTGYLNAWPDAGILGTASDASPFAQDFEVSGVASVQIKVQRAWDGLYYNGSDWEQTTRWIQATEVATTNATMTWFLPFTPTVETSYTITSVAIDNCSNVQSVPSVSTFTYDVGSPSSEIATSGYFNSWAGFIEGVASDAVSGVAHVQIQLQRDGLYYDGSFWTVASHWITASGTVTWMVPFSPTVEAVYTVTSSATDYCGNVQTVPDTATFVYDVTPPSSPFNLSVEPSAWTPVNSFTVTWNGLSDVSGIIAAHYKWDTAPASNEDESPGSPALGEGIQSISGITVPVEGARQLFVWLEDKAGNVNFQTRNATSPGAFRWDATPPGTSVVNLDARQGCSNWYVSAVQVNLQAMDVNPDPGTVNATSGISATFWRQDGNTWHQVAESSFEIADQGVHLIEYYSVDIAGNQETPHAISPTIKIDTMPPTTSQPTYTGTLGPNEWYRSAVSVSLSALDVTSGVSVTYYQVDTDTVKAGTSFYVSADGAHTIRYYSVDMACNQETVQTTTLKIDKTYPTTAYQLQGQLGCNGWFVASPVTVTLSASDVVTGVALSSGVDQVRYRIDGGPWQVRGASTSFAVAAPAGQGEYARTVEYYALDLAGNAEPVRTLTIGIDFRAPSALPFRPYVLPSGWTNVNCFDIRWYQNPQDFSGIGGAYYSFSVPVSPTDGILVLGDDLTSIPCVQVPAELGDGLHNVYVWVRDKACNSDQNTSHSVTVALDRTPPELAPLVAGNQCGTAGWYNSPITVTFVTTDNLSGMAGGVISYQVNGGGWVAGASYSEFRDGRYVIECRARDAAGNVSEVVTKVVKVDRTAPDAPSPIWVEPGDWSRDSIFTVRWVNPWDLSGLAGVYYKQGSLPAAPTDGTYVDGLQTSLSIPASAEGVVPVYVWLVDRACNMDHQKRAMATLKYDRTPPTTTFSISGTLGGDGWYTSAVLIMLNCTDNHSGCGQGSGHYRVGTGPWQDGNSFLIEADGTTPFSYYSLDVAGNTESTRTASVKVDSTAPTSYAYSDSYSPSPSFTVRWEGDDAISGIASFDVQYRRGIAEPWQDWAPAVDPLQRSKLFTGVRGEVYYFRTRARDKAGNVEPYPPVPDTYVSVDPLLNGDFERDIGVEWEIGGVCQPTRVYTQSYTGGNTHVVVLGCPGQKNGAPVGESMVCQTITMPNAQNMPSPALRFRYRIFTYDILWGPTTFKFYDSFNVGLGDPGVAPTYVFTDGNPGPEYGSLLDMGWREGTVDLTPYAGRTLKICLANVTRVDTSYNTWTLIDDVRMVYLEHKVLLPIVSPQATANVQQASPAQGLSALVQLSAPIDRGEHFVRR